MSSGSWETVDGYSEISTYTGTDMSADEPIVIRDRRLLNLSAVVLNAGDTNSRYLEFETNRYEDGIDISDSSKFLITVYQKLVPSDTALSSSTSEYTAASVKRTSTKVRFGIAIKNIENSGRLHLQPRVKAISSGGLTYVLKMCDAVVEVRESID